MTALMAFYLNSDGAMSEGAQYELHAHFSAEPLTVVKGIAAIGDQLAPHFPDMTAAQQLCRDIASYNVS